MDEDYFRHLKLLHDERNSLLYWYPKVKDIAPTPRTECVVGDIIGATIRANADATLPRGMYEKIRKIAREFGYPVFIRTDIDSDKHNYKNTCFVESEDKLLGNIMEMLANIIAFKELYPRAICVREFIELDWKFKAFWGELPIAPEVRVMFRDHEIERWFFYWVEDAIIKPSVSNWRELLAEMRQIAEDEQGKFLSIAERVAKVFDGYWSVDFARTRKGEWILIDMALGEVSWTPEDTKKKSRENLFSSLLKGSEGDSNGKV